MIKSTGHIIHDGVEYFAGDTFEATNNEVEQLIDFGVAEVIVEPVEEPIVEPEVDLASMKRAELVEKAIEAGVENPDELPNKGAIIDAINTANDATEEPAEDISEPVIDEEPIVQAPAEEDDSETIVEPTEEVK